MRRPIGWIDRECESGKREIRVTFHGEFIKWQFLAEGAEDWDYTSKPSEENWLQLEQKLADLWQRGHTCRHEMELAKKRSPAPNDQNPQKKKQ